MEDILLLDATERYFRGEMGEAEKESSRICEKTILKWTSLRRNTIFSGRDGPLW